MSLDQPPTNYKGGQPPQQPARLSIVWVLLLVAPIFILGILFPQDRSPAPPSDAFRATLGPPVDDDDADLEAALLALAEYRGDQRTAIQIMRDNSLIRAAKRGDLIQVRRAIGRGASVNSAYIDGGAFLGSNQSGYTALMWASGAGHADVVAELIKRGADPNVERERRSALYFAAIRGHEKVVQLLQAADARGDPRQIRLSNELIRAACRDYRMEVGEPFPPFPGVPGNVKTARELEDVLADGIDVNVSNPDGYTALMFAANLGLVDSVRNLLAAGANAELKSIKGETALSLAERDDYRFRPKQRRNAAELIKRHLAKRD